jgi:hypothetical protein
VTELRQPDTSLLPRSDGSALLLGELLIYPSNGGGWGEKDCISVQTPDGNIERRPEMALRLIYEAVLAGATPVLSQQVK